MRGPPGPASRHPGCGRELADGFDVGWLGAHQTVRGPRFRASGLPRYPTAPGHRASYECLLQRVKRWRPRAVAWPWARRGSSAAGRSPRSLDAMVSALDGQEARPGAAPRHESVGHLDADNPVGVPVSRKPVEPGRSSAPSNKRAGAGWRRLAVQEPLSEGVTLVDGGRRWPRAAPQQRSRVRVAPGPLWKVIPRFGFGRGGDFRSLLCGGELPPADLHVAAVHGRRDALSRTTPWRARERTGAGAPVRCSPPPRRTYRRRPG